ncbi:MAG: hypothetical protein NVS2B6_09130 [Thermoleophilaceae bacterium]
MKPVSLLMPNRNNDPVLELTLDRLAANTTYPSFELIVVDDSSTDSSREILRRWRDSGRFDSFTLIEKDEQGGVAAGLNTALEAASGELMVSLDGDATVETPGWLERLVGFHQSDPRVGVVSAGIVFDGAGLIHAYGVEVIGPEGLHDRGTRIREPIGRRTMHNNADRAHSSPTDRRLPPAEVDASIGCCMLFSRDLADELGGYDLGFTPVWFEDIDLSLSSRRLGAKVFAMPEVEVVHRVSLRNPRDSQGRWQAPRAAQQAFRLLPDPVRGFITRTTHVNDPSPAHMERLRGHYRYWREKWGFDPLNPDMDSVFARYRDTEVCWRYSTSMSTAGQQIIEAWRSRETGPATP